MAFERSALSAFQIKPYKQQFDYFDQYLLKHRQHQLEGLLATCNTTKGQLRLPCGTGKTIIQVSLHILDMIELSQANECGVFVIASHRLSLNRQLLMPLVDTAVRCGLPFDLLYLGSYKCDLGQYYKKYFNLGYCAQVSRHLASTNAKEIEQFVATAREMGRHVIIASTYDSFARLKNIGTINQITFDEAHNTLEDVFTNNITVIKPNINKEYYFTATPKVSNQGGGMNNEEFYGKLLFDAFPIQMIERGEIVSPRMHIIKGEDDETTNTSDTDMLAKNTVEGFFAHREMVKKVSCNPNEIGAKLLVGCNSIGEMNRIYEHENIRALSEKNVQVFAISSDGCSVNWQPKNKEEFFNALMALSNAEDVLILNIDMLTEGIDLPSITGVMPFRNLGPTKLIQLAGRAMRLHSVDRNKLYSNELEPTDYSKYVKPYGFLIIPRHLSTINRFQEMIDQAKEFYTVYGTTPDQLVIEEKYMPLKPLTLDTMIPYPFKDGKEYDLEHSESPIVDEANLRIFREKMVSLGNDQYRIKYFTETLLK